MCDDPYTFIVNIIQALYKEISKFSNSKDPFVVKIAIDIDAELAAYEIKFMLLTSSIIFDMRRNKIKDSIGKTELAKKIDMENMMETIQKIEEKVRLGAVKAGITNYDIKKCSIPIDIKRSGIDMYDSCPKCEIKMIIKPDKYEMVCSKCGLIKKISDTTFDSIIDNEIQKAKSGSFDPERHFKIWWRRITATEAPEEIGDKNDPENTQGEKLILRLRALVRRDKVILQRVSVDNIRNWLHEIKKSELYKNVSLIKSKLTGVPPPEISDEIKQKVYQKLKKAIVISNLMQRTRKNRSYYPFYIMKLLDHELPKNDPARRIFHYIHFQGNDTIICDDKDWEIICKRIGIIPVPTNKSLLLAN